MVIFDKMAHAFEPDESRMAFIAVVDVGLDAKRNECPHASDTKDQFLFQPVLNSPPYR